MQFCAASHSRLLFVGEGGGAAEDAGEEVGTFEKCSSSKETRPEELVVGSAGDLSGQRLDVMRMRLAQVGWLPFKGRFQSEPGARARTSSL